MSPEQGWGIMNRGDRWNRRLILHTSCHAPDKCPFLVPSLIPRLHTIQPRQGRMDFTARSWGNGNDPAIYAHERVALDSEGASCMGYEADLRSAPSTHQPPPHLNPLQLGLSSVNPVIRRQPPACMAVKKGMVNGNMESSCSHSATLE